MSLGVVGVAKAHAPWTFALLTYDDVEPGLSLDTPHTGTGSRLCISAFGALTSALEATLFSRRRSLPMSCAYTQNR